MKAYDEDKIPEFLKMYRNVAVVGISNKPERDSYRVASYLKSHGFNVIPINPTMESWEGIRAYPDLKSIPTDVKIDIVDVFRKPDAVKDIVEEAASISTKLIWMQESVINEEAADLAKSKGMDVVMDRCMMKEHSALQK